MFSSQYLYILMVFYSSRKCVFFYEKVIQSWDNYCSSDAFKPFYS